ncbi:MAG: glutamate racemase [Candidatus Pacebacteria bacterium CG_4_10_14_0_8_um_filter_42_14]|nr:MAG: glutamate racemase [Candidatus Pacebacteria bacterium CG_4_10_14_0_8_um_filter_42_14]
MTIGLIDSGIGGLSILRALEKELPQNQYVYLADSANFPYSEKSPQDLQKAAAEHVRELIYKHNCEITVLACNTLSVVALAYLRSQFPAVPFVGTVPPVKAASEELEPGNTILVIATKRTAESSYLAELIYPYKEKQNFIVVGTTDLVIAIEAEDNVQINNVLNSINNDLQNNNVDSIVLGCTHFPLITRKIQEVFKKEVKIYSPTTGVVKQVKRLTQEGNENYSSRLLDKTNRTKFIKTTIGNQITKYIAVNTITYPI